MPPSKSLRGSAGFCGSRCGKQSNKRSIGLAHQHGGPVASDGGKTRGDAPQAYCRQSLRAGFFIKTEEIDWIEAADNYVCLHIGAKSHLIRETLSNIELQLSATMFARIHRGAIVNLERIKELYLHFHGEHVVILQNGTRLMLSRNYRHNLPHLLGKAGQ